MANIASQDDKTVYDHNDVLQNKQRREASRGKGNNRMYVLIGQKLMRSKSHQEKKQGLELKSEKFKSEKQKKN